MKFEDNLNIDIIDETPEQQVETSAKAELNEDITYDSDDDVLPKDILPDMFVSKPKPADSEIFDDKVEKVIAKVKESDNTPEIKVVKEEQAEEESVPMDTTNLPTIKLTKKGKPRKPMTEDHKAKLAVAREKAMAKKKYLATERKIAKMKENKDNQNKKDDDFDTLQATQKIELARLEKIERDKEEAAFQESKQKEVKNNNSAITRADLEEMSMKTLIAMETLRKKRKAEKKKVKAEQQYQAEVMNTIKKASPSWILNDSPFNDCF